MAALHSDPGTDMNDASNAFDTANDYADASFIETSADDTGRSPHANAPGSIAELMQGGRIALDGARLRVLRHSRLLSQQDLADDCWRRNIRVSIATIKRAESGSAVRFRIARELARCFDVPVMQIIGVAALPGNAG